MGAGGSMSMSVIVPAAIEDVTGRSHCEGDERKSEARWPNWDAWAQTSQSNLDVHADWGLSHSSHVTQYCMWASLLSWFVFIQIYQLSTGVTMRKITVFLASASSVLSLFHFDPYAYDDEGNVAEVETLSGP